MFNLDVLHFLHHHLSLSLSLSEALFHLQYLVLLGLSHWSLSAFVKIFWSTHFYAT